MPAKANATEYRCDSLHCDLMPVASRGEPPKSSCHCLDGLTPIKRETVLRRLQELLE